jgi:hypothetical protein
MRSRRAMAMRRSERHGRTIAAPARPSTSGDWAIAPPSRESRGGELDDVHAGERRAPHEDLLRVDAGMLRRPADDSAVVLALAGTESSSLGCPVESPHWR